jgi:hypothetical protein
MEAVLLQLVNAIAQDNKQDSNDALMALAKINAQL